MGTNTYLNLIWGEKSAKKGEDKDPGMYSTVCSKSDCRILLVLSFHSKASHGLYSLLEDEFGDVFQHLQKYVFFLTENIKSYVFTDQC